MVGCYNHFPQIGLQRAPPHMHDHRLAMDVGERLLRQAGGVQA
jgi:hypothetical protein